MEMKVTGKNASWFMCLVIICLFVNFSDALEASAKKGAKKDASAKPAGKDTKKDKQEAATPQYTKAEWMKYVQFAIYSKEKNATEMYIVGVGDTLDYIVSEQVSLKVYVKEVLVNPAQPQNAAVSIVVTKDDLAYDGSNSRYFRRNEQIFDGLVYQAFPNVDPFEKGGFGGYQGFNLRFVTGHPLMNLSPITNNIVSDKGGKLFLIHRGSLYFKLDELGDKWDRVMQNVRAIATDPSNSNILYVLTLNNAVQKSMDGGKNWLTINNGLPSNTGFLNIIVNPHNTQEVFVLTNSGLFKTTDAGFSWVQTNLRDAVFQLLIHPKDKTVYYARTISGPYISKDAGASWSKIDDSLPKKVVKGKGRTAEHLPVTVLSLAFQSYSNPHLLAITEDNGILRSDNNGLSWKEFNNGFQKSDGAYAIATTDSATYIGSYGVIYVLSVSGDRWEKINMHSTFGNAVAGINSIYPLGDNKGFIITDSSEKIIHIDKNNRPIGLNYGMLPHSRVITIDNITVNSQQRLCATVSNNNFIDKDNYGLFCSTDNGTTWGSSIIYPRPYDAQKPKLYVSPQNSNELWFLGHAQGWYLGNSDVRRSMDGGKTWRVDPNWGAPSCFVFDNIDSNVKYACRGSLLRFDEKTNKLTDLKVKAKRFAIAQNDNKTLLAGTKISNDGGWTWSDLFQNIKGLDKELDSYSDETMTAARPIYFDGKNIVLGINADQGYILSSNDSGRSWEIIRKQRNGFEFIFLNPFDTNNIFIAFKDALKDEANRKEYSVIRISQSLDRGRTWKPFALYTPKNDISTSMAISKLENKYVVYVGTFDGLFKTIDNGNNWVLVGGIQSSNNKKDNLRIASPLPPDVHKLEAVTITKNISYSTDVVLTWEELVGKKLISARKTYRGLIAPGPMYIEDQDRNKPYEFTIKCTIAISEKGDATLSSINSADNDGRRFFGVAGIKDMLSNLVKVAVEKWKFTPFVISDQNVQVVGEISVPVKIIHSDKTL